jgi:mannosylglycerate hydrolase
VGIEKPASTGKLSSNVFVFNPHPFPVKTQIRIPVLFANPDGEWAASTPERGLTAVNGRGAVISVDVEFSEERVARSAFLETTWGRRYHVAMDLNLPPMGYDIVHVFETNESAHCNSHVEHRPIVTVLETSEYRLGADNGEISFFDKLTRKKFAKILSFEYETDSGDTYSFSTVTGNISILGTLKTLDWHPQRRQTLLARFTLLVPKKFDRTHKAQAAQNSETRQQDLCPLDIEVLISKSQSAAINFELNYQNVASDGRLRALFPVGFTAHSLKVDGHFRVAERSVPPVKEPIKRPYPGEIPYETFHQGDYAFAEDGDNRTWLANRGNPEISIVQCNNESWFAITLHRSVGSLSVYGGATRHSQAGPEVPTPEAQCLRAFQHHLSWGNGNISSEEVRARATVFACPPFSQEMPYLPYLNVDGKIPRTQSFLEIENPQIALDSCRPWSESGANGESGEGCANGISIRLHNLSNAPQQAILKLGFSALEYCITDLNELWNTKSARVVQNGTVCFAIRPFEIGTVIIK